MKNIKETEELFDDIFRESLENVNTPVPNGVWEGVSSSIGSSSAVAGVAVKTALWMKAAIAVVSVSAIAVIAYQMLDSKDSKIESELPAITQDNSPVVKTEVPENDSPEKTKSFQSDPSGKFDEINSSNKNGEEDNDGIDYSDDSHNEEPSNEINSNGPNQIYSIDANNVIKIDSQEPSDKEQKTSNDASGKEEGNEGKVVEQPTEPIEYQHYKDSSYIFIPNAFTSNGDGINDTYIIKIVGEESFEMIISTLDNKILYRTTNKYQGWNCKLPNGELAPAGAYLVKVIYKFKGSEVKTDIRKLTLIK